MDIRQEWGRNIRAARRSRGLTQLQLAEACDVDQGTVSRWERGKMIPDESHKVTVARVLAADGRDLFPLA